MSIEHFEYVLVKQEVDLADYSKTEEPGNTEEETPELIKNIKEEIRSPTPNNQSIENDGTQPPPSPDSSGSGTWLVPIKQEILPEDYLQVTIKQEEDEDPASGDSAGEQAITSTEDRCEGQSPSSSLKCEICNRIFTNLKDLEIHIQSHNKTKLQCDHCPSKFTTKLLLKTHILKNHSENFEGKKPHQCPNCPLKFPFVTNLEKHKEHCKPNSPYTCEVCNKMFEKRHLYNSHLQMHNTERPFACAECPLSFKYKSTLVRHGHVHTRIRPYGCPYCDKTFTSSGLLKPHLRKHTGEKPFTCELCNKKFAHKHNMQRHFVSHEKVKHTVCDICHREFPRESRLKYHMKTHVNEKFFVCKFCPKRFSHKQNVQRHYMRKHPGKTYEGKETDASVAAKIWDTMKKRICDEESEEILG